MIVVKIKKKKGSKKQVIKRKHKFESYKNCLEATQLVISPEERQKSTEEMRLIKLLDNTPNQPTNFRTKNWIQINDDTRGTYNKSN